jgi:hypothetical protein
VLRAAAVQSAAAATAVDPVIVAQCPGLSNNLTNTQPHVYALDDYNIYNTTSGI